MKKIAMAVSALAVLFGGAVVSAPEASASPFRYHSTYYGDAKYWSCYQRGNQGLQNNEWYDYDCRPESTWVNLYIQISPN